MYEERKKSCKNRLKRRLCWLFLTLIILAPFIIWAYIDNSEPYTYFILIITYLFFSSPLIFLIIVPIIEIHEINKLENDPYEVITLDGEVVKSDCEPLICIRCFGYNPFTNNETEFKIYEDIEEMNVIKKSFKVEIYINMRTGEYHVDDDVVIAKLENRIKDKF